MGTGSRARSLVATSVADVWVILRMTPDWSSLAHHLGAPRVWLQTAGTDTAATDLVGALLWCVGCWLAVGLLATALSALPGRAGAVGARAASVVMPALLRRVIIGAATVSIVMTPATANAALTVAQPSATAVQPSPAPTTSAGPAIAWPVDIDGVTSPTGGGVPSPPSVSWPTDAAPHASQRPATETSEDVVVRSGDSLWLIAAHRLGDDASDAQIAALWPQWYAANHDAIGANPSVLTPGTHLVPPSTEN
jgi:hypothetical protein